MSGLDFCSNQMAGLIRQNDPIVQLGPVWNEGALWILICNWSQWPSDLPQPSLSLYFKHANSHTHAHTHTYTHTLTHTLSHTNSVGLTRTLFFHSCRRSISLIIFLHLGILIVALVSMQRTQLLSVSTPITLVRSDHVNHNNKAKMLITQFCYNNSSKNLGAAGSTEVTFIFLT